LLCGDSGSQNRHQCHANSLGHRSLVVQSGYRLFESNHFIGVATKEVNERRGCTEHHAEAICRVVFGKQFLERCLVAIGELEKRV
jgi:hypothetical protein